MSGAHSRNKGARSERQLRDELIRHGWQDVRRVPLSGAVKTSLAYQDDVVGTAPNGAEVRFENKARATGFEAIYGLLPPSIDVLAFGVYCGPLAIISLNPNLILDHARDQGVPEITTFDAKTQKVMRSVLKKCADWIGNAQVLSLKQDRHPFLYVRYFR